MSFARTTKTTATRVPIEYFVALALVAVAGAIMIATKSWDGRWVHLGACVVAAATAFAAAHSAADANSKTHWLVVGGGGATVAAVVILVNFDDIASALAVALFAASLVCIERGLTR